MSRPHRPLPDLVAWLDDYFEIDRSSPDPSFRRHLPAVYDAIGFDWRSAFLPEFTTRFNGLLLAGDNAVGHIWLLSFPEAGIRKQAEIDRYLPTTRLVGLGLSHAGSEFLVMKELAPFFAAELGLPATAVPENIWWR
jgi:hypothetical protein